jgi:fructose-1,6-bisphosphatase
MRRYSLCNYLQKFIDNLKDKLYNEKVKCRKIKDITIPSFESEITRLKKEVIIDPPLNSKIPFRRMHQKQALEQLKLKVIENKIFKTQPEAIEIVKRIASKDKCIILENSQDDYV